MADKIALAPCNGMSPNGLVSRVAVGDCREEHDDVISICMGSTSADIDGKNNEMLKKCPIIAVNGCDGACVNKILENKGINVFKTVSVGEILENFSIESKDSFRLDNDGEKSVEILKNELNKVISNI